MARESRVAWREGLFLRPQHFQQQERYFDALARTLTSAVRPYPWGIRSLAVSESHASRGQFALESCSGILPDGTPFSLPADQAPPAPLDVPADTRDAEVYLTLQSRIAGATEFVERERARADVRILVSEEEAHDAFSPERAAEAIEIGTLNLNCGITREQTEGRVCLGLARIHEVVNGQVVFDKRHIPPLLDIRGSVRVQGFLNDIVGRLDQRVEELALRAVDATEGGSETFANFLMLQTLNRMRPVLLHLRALPAVHPERLYEVFAALAGELATFTRAERRAPGFPDYDHENLQLTFEPVFESLQQSLSALFERSAGQLKLEAVGPGAYTARIDDHSLFQTCSFYLAASARVPGENLRTRFPSVVKIGTVAKMREIVGSSLQPGVRIAPSNIAPPQIRVLPGYTYFELDRSSRDWADLTTAPAVGIHIAGDWPDLKLELWWVKRPSR
ncbi:MAG TPA: type VI secretion system baseplate subunit TssK [Rhizomicrobium sp.]